MAVRRQRATTSREIMEKSIDSAIKKAKVRFRDSECFYILKYTVEDDYYFASEFPELNKETGEEVFYQKWIFDNGWKKAD